MVLALSALAGGLAWTEREVSLMLPVCDYHRRRGRRSTRTLVRGMALTALLGVGAYFGSYFHESAGSYLGVAAMFAFMITLFVGMHEVDDGLGLKSVAADSLILTGVHRQFAEAVDLRADVRT